MKKQNILSITNMIIVGIALLITLTPIGYMVVKSFQLPSGSGWSLQAYRGIIEKAPLLQWLGNSLFITVVKTVFQILLAVIASYIFARIDFYGKNLLFILILSMMMMPPQVLMMPLYFTVDLFGWVDSFLGVIVPQLVSAYMIFMMRQAFLKVPHALVESAQIEGCTFFQILYHVYLPITKPSVVTAIIIGFSSNWNEYNWTLLVLKDKMKFTLPIASSFFSDGVNFQIPEMMAVSLVTILPLLILYAIFQKQIVENYANSGIK